MKKKNRHAAITPKNCTEHNFNSQYHYIANLQHYI